MAELVTPLTLPQLQRTAHACVWALMLMHAPATSNDPEPVAHLPPAPLAKLPATLRELRGRGCSLASVDAAPAGLLSGAGPAVLSGTGGRMWTAAEPLLVRGGGAGWPALGKWNASWLEARRRGGGATACLIASVSAQAVEGPNTATAPCIAVLI